MKNFPQRKIATVALAVGLAAALGAAGVPAAAASPQLSAVAQSNPTAGLQDFEGHHPADWLADVATALAGAQDDVAARVAHKAPGEKLAIVFDIDNTTLATDFAQDDDHIPAIAASLALAKKANSLGVKVFFVSNRLYNGDRKSNSSTKRSLTKVGYPVYEVYHQTGDHRIDSQVFKTASREDITDRGYTIIANVGNRQKDLDGGYAEKTYKLPDYDGDLQ